MTDLIKGDNGKFSCDNVKEIIYFFFFRLEWLKNRIKYFYIFICFSFTCYCKGIISCTSCDLPGIVFTHTLL